MDQIQKLKTTLLAKSRMQRCKPAKLFNLCNEVKSCRIYIRALKITLKSTSFARKLISYLKHFPCVTLLRYQPITSTCSQWSKILKLTKLTFESNLIQTLVTILGFKMFQGFQSQLCMYCTTMYVLYKRIILQYYFSKGLN